jgi:hypothetical protein
MKLPILALATLLAPSAHAAGTSFSCFSKYYTANQNEITISGEISDDDSVRNLKVDSEAYGIKINLKSASANENYTPRKYKGYQQFLLGKNPLGHDFQSLDLLLPENLTKLNGKFDGYMSDANADGEGSDGYFRVLCKTE